MSIIVSATNRFNIKLKSHTGFVTLATVMILLICTTLIVSYSAKQGLIEQWITGNDRRYNTGFTTTEAGLNQAISKYKVYSSMTAEPAGCSLIDRSTWTGETFCVNRTQMLSADGKTVQFFRATGTSDDGSANINMQQLMGFGSITGLGAPAAPVVADGSVGTGGNFNIVANPNGGGIGTPVTIWSSGAVDLGSSSATCQPQYMVGHDCPNPAASIGVLSKEGNVGLDVVDDAPKVASGGTFPNDVFAYLFGEPASNYLVVRDKAKAIIDNSSSDNCGTLTTASKGLYWIEGGVTCRLGDVSSPPDMVILVLDETPLELNANNEVYGYVMTFDHPGNAIGGQDIKINGGAKILGSLLSNYDLGTHLNGTLGIVWRDYSSLLLNPGSSDYGILSVIPGGWLDDF